MKFEMKEVKLGEVQLYCDHKHEHNEDPCFACEYKDELCINKNIYYLRFGDDKISFDDDQLAVMRQLYSCGIRYIARDSNTCLRIFDEKPNKGRWVWEEIGFYQSIPSDLFPQILSENKKPICITDYINVEEIK